MREPVWFYAPSLFDSYRSRFVDADFDPMPCSKCKRSFEEHTANIDLRCPVQPWVKFGSEFGVQARDVLSCAHQILGNYILDSLGGK
jgi:hypothetical protein